MTRNSRISSALRTATGIASGAAIVGFFANLAPAETDSFSMPVRLLIGTVAGFALFFALSFPLALAFPPTIDADGRPRFPGARLVIWPVIGVLSGWVGYLVWRS